MTSTQISGARRNVASALIFFTNRLKQTLEALESLAERQLELANLENGLCPLDPPSRIKAFPKEEETLLPKTTRKRSPSRQAPKGPAKTDTIGHRILLILRERSPKGMTLEALLREFPTSTKGSLRGILCREIKKGTLAKKGGVYRLVS